MSFKENLTKKRTSPAAIFHKFRVDSSIRTRQHVFVEGYEDVGYYSRYITPSTGSYPKFHLCFGKKNLDEVARMFWSSSLQETLAYFIRDSDFDGFLRKIPDGRNFFVTCGYAVENYVCTPQAISNYLRSILCVDETEIDVEKLVEDYRVLIESFHAWLSPIYGAAMHAAEDGRPVDLNKLKVEDHFGHFLQQKEPPTYADLQDISTTGISDTDFNDASKKMGVDYSSLPALQWMRGKFLLTAATSYLRKVEQEIREKQKAGLVTQFNRKAAANLNEPSVFDKLSGLAEPTTRLVEFLHMNKND